MKHFWAQDIQMKVEPITMIWHLGKNADLGEQLKMATS